MDILNFIRSEFNVTLAAFSFLVALLFYYWYRRPKNFPPGPRGIPMIGILPFLSRFPEKDFKKWSDTYYGPVMSVRLGMKDWVVLNDYETIHKALVKAKAQFSGRPRNPVFDMISGGGYGLAFVDFGPLWKSQRKFGLTTLRGLGVGKKSMEERVAEEVSYLIRAIQNYEEKPFDILKPLSNAVSNNICSVVFGKRFEYDDPRFTESVHHLSRGLQDPKSNGLINGIVLAPFLAKIPPFKNALKRRKQDVTITEKFVQDIINEHKETLETENPRDFIDVFLIEMNQSSDSAFTEYQLRRFCHDLFFAGTETTTSTLRWGILSLLHHPETQNKLHKEISNIIGSERTVTMSDRMKMPYTCAFIEELYRFRTLVPKSVAHKTTEDVTIGGYLIPKDTQIAPNLWAVHNDPKIWKEPEKFIPERHLDNDGKFVKSNYVIPFSIGPRYCLGEQLARMEVFIFLVSLLQKFGFQPSPDDHSLPEINDGSNGGAFIPLKYNVVAKDLFE